MADMLHDLLLADLSVLTHRGFQAHTYVRAAETIAAPICEAAAKLDVRRYRPYQWALGEAQKRAQEIVERVRAEVGTKHLDAIRADSSFRRADSINFAAEEMVRELAAAGVATYKTQAAVMLTHWLYGRLDAAAA